MDRLASPSESHTSEACFELLDGRFPFSPATVVFDEWDEYHLWIASEVLCEEEGDSCHLVFRGFGEEKWFPLHDLHQPALHRWQGNVLSMDGRAGTRVTVRPTVEADAPRSVTMEGITRAPMPLSVIRDLHASNGEFEHPELLAVVEPDTTVSDVVLYSGSGMFVRDGSRWYEFRSGEVISDLRLERISAEGLAAFDSAGGGEARLRLGALGWLAP